jgi:hypothetical protein
VETLERPIAWLRHLRVGAAAAATAAAATCEHRFVELVFAHQIERRLGDQIQIENGNFGTMIRVH